MPRFKNSAMVKLSKGLAVCLLLAGLSGCPQGKPKQESQQGDVQAEPAAKPQQPAAPAKAEAAPSARDVLDRMAAAYQKATSYADMGMIHLQAVAGDEKIDQKAPFSFALERPNKLHLEAYQAMIVCDGKDFFAAISNLPNQVLRRESPMQLGLTALFLDPILAEAWTQGFGGAMPQVVLLMGEKPLETLLTGSEDIRMSEPGQIEGRECYRVRITRPDGEATLWIDREDYVLRRLVLPTDMLRQEMSREKPVESISLVADFTGARLNGPVDPKAFAFETPRDARLLTAFMPPAMLLLGQKAPPMTFHDLDGKPVSIGSLAGKVVVLDFWGTEYEPCRQSLPRLEAVRERYKDNPKVVFLAVSVDRRRTENKELTKLFDELKVKTPIVRDLDETAHALQFTGIPTLFVIGPDGTIQHCEAGGDPKLVETLPAKIDALLAGQAIFQKSLDEYKKQADEYAKMIEAKASRGGSASGGETVEERSAPRAKPAERTQPAKLKLSRLWKCEDVKSPGNIAVLPGQGGPARLLVIDHWKSVVEVGLDGKLIARHPIEVGEKEFVGHLRLGVGSDGRRWIVALTLERCHVFDQDWRPMGRYPEDALEHPHAGISDVRLDDLDGDGHLKMYVGYFGAAGIQAVPLPLEGQKRLWSNRSMLNVGSLAILPTERKGHGDLYCTNNTGSVVILDAKGQRAGEITVRNRMIGCMAAASIQPVGGPSWCGLSASEWGENVVVGFTLKGEELWSYALPSGIPSSPVELIVPGRLLRDGPGQWLLPGADGSIHILTPDGKLLDKFNYGAVLQGLATVDIGGQPALVVATDQGLEAWRVE